MGKLNPLPPERKIGFSEGIDDIDVSIAFSKLQNFPQFKIIRNIPLKAVLNHISQDKIKILDFGCGSGHFLVDLYKKINRRYSNFKIDLYGLDITQTMLDRCNESFRKRNIDTIHLLLGDGKKIPCDNDYFDIVSTSLSLHHWEDPIQILNEIYRVLKRGGNFILFDFHRTAPTRWYKFLNFITKNVVPKALRKANEPLGSLLASYTESEVKSIVERTNWRKNKLETTYHGSFLQYVFSK